jgi:hypothetical protein
MRDVIRQLYSKFDCVLKTVIAIMVTTLLTHYVGHQHGFVAGTPWSWNQFIGQYSFLVNLCITIVFSLIIVAIWRKEVKQIFSE